MRKSIKLCTLIASCTLLLTGCKSIRFTFGSGINSSNSINSQISSFGNTSISTSSSQYEYNTSLVSYDERGRKIYIRIKAERRSIVTEETYQLSLRKIDYVTLEDIGEYTQSGFTWMTSDENIASISENGLITGKKQGDIEVRYITTDDPSLSLDESTFDLIHFSIKEKELDNISIINCRKEYLINKEVVPSASVSVSYTSGFVQKIGTSKLKFDTSKVDKDTLGQYPVSVSYTYNGITKKTYFDINIVAKLSVSPQELNQNYKDYYDQYYFTRSPSQGDLKWLVLPLNFTDTSNYITSSDKKDNVKQDLNTAFFGTQEQTGWHSVKTWYETESRGKITLNGKVAEWFDVGFSSSEVEDGYEEHKIKTIVERAVESYFSNNPEEDWHDYDYDNDGYLDGVSAIYGCPSNHTGVRLDNPITNKNFWPKVIRSSIPSKISSTRKVGHYMWVSYEDMYEFNNPKTISRTGSKYGDGDLSHVIVDSHTFRHESGHIFGLEDLYDYSGNYLPMGGFTLQVNNLGDHDPYSRLALGWGKVYIPEDTVTIELKDSESSGEFVLLTPSWNEYNSMFDEYILVELFSPKGLNEFDCTYYDYGQNKPGIRIYHIDSRLVQKDGKGDYNLPFYNDVTLGSMELAMSNSFDSPNRISVLGSDYQEYNLVQLIRDDVEDTIRTTSRFSDTGLFFEGSSFSMSKYALQFVNGSKLNSGIDLGWSFNVGEINNDLGVYSTYITFTKD